MIRTLSAPLGDRHQLLCSTYGDEIWRQSFLCGRAVVWNSLPAAVCHADSLHSFKCRLKSHFFSFCFSDWQCNVLQVRFRALEGTKLPFLFYSILFYSILKKMTTGITAIIRMQTIMRGSLTEIRNSRKKEMIMKYTRYCRQKRLPRVR